MTKDVHNKTNGSSEIVYEKGRCTKNSIVDYCLVDTVDRVALQ
jgi:hypothetical protein